MVQVCFMALGVDFVTANSLEEKDLHRHRRIEAFVG